MSNSITRVSDFGLFLEKLINPYEGKILRIPFYMTSTFRQMNNKPGVNMLVNPSSIAFSQEKRITEQLTQGGRVFYHWSDEAGRNNDILRIDFSGQTGNIDVRAGSVKSGVGNIGALGSAINSLNEKAKEIAGKGEGSAGRVITQGGEYMNSGASKLSNFHNLWALTREPMYDVQKKVRVYYLISMSLPSFGNTFVTFIGHFSRGLEFTEDAQKPFSKDYTFSFNVEASMPNLSDLYDSVCSNLSTVVLNPRM
jgi:hypothetical protein